MNSGVDFDVDVHSPVIHRSKRISLGQWLVNHSAGFIKNEGQANRVLFGFVIVVIIFSIFWFARGSAVGNPSDIKILPA